MKRNYFLIIFSILFCSCSSITLREGLNFNEKEDWLAIGRDEGKTNISSQTVKLNPPFKEIWNYNAESGFGRNALAVSDGVLFAGCLNGKVHAVNLNNGSGIGKAYTKSKSCFSNPLINRNIIVLTFSDGMDNYITGYDFISGEFKWKNRTEKVMSSPVLKDENIFFAATTGKIYCVNSESGEKSLKYRNDFSYFTSPTIMRNLLLTGDIHGVLSAVNYNSGELAWSFKTKGGIYSDVSVWKDKLFFGSDDGYFYCLDSAGNLLWKKNLETKFLASSTFIDDNVICAGINGKIYSLNINTGEANWEYATRGTITASPVLNNDKIFIGSFDMYFYCIDAKKGEVLWKYYLDDRVRTTAVIWKNFIIVANDDKSIYCFQ